MQIGILNYGVIQQHDIYDTLYHIIHAEEVLCFP